MSAVDRNKIFFGLIQYILSEQMNVDWILKTSLVNFTGINSTVTDQKYEKKSLSDDIIDYIYQVKPYHVQFEQFIEKYSSKQDICNVLPQDYNSIEVDIRFDAITSKVDEQGDMTDIQFMDTHAANRLWVCKHNDFNDDEMKSYINDVLNCHFKGITVDGSEFDIDKFGYDAFLYDDNLYDAPTVSAEYYIIDKSEKLPYPYVKEYVAPNISTFNLSGKYEIGDIKVFRNGNEETYTYHNGILTIYSPLSVNDKLIVENKVNGVRNGYVYACTSFQESNDESSICQFVNIDTNEFKIPDSQFGSRKVTVHIQYPNGTRIPTLNYDRTDGGLIIKDELKEGYHVIITVIDFAELYDKIYTYEDCYGQSNNLISLDGNDFLRPYYEKDRPSELIVTYPISNLKIYTQDDNRVKSLYEIDFKLNNKEMAISKTMTTKLKQDLKAGDKIIIVDNIKRLKLPYVNNSNTKIPGKIMVNSEVIEFYDYDESENMLKSIRRGVNGSYIAETHLKGDLVYNYNDQAIKQYNYNTPSIMKECNDGEVSFEIPETFVSKDKLKVWKKGLIKLLTDIRFDSSSFIINSNLIDLPDENIGKKGWLYINDDKIVFDTIKEIKKKGEKTYEISGFTVDKEYMSDNSVIYSSKPIQLNDVEYSLSNDMKTIILKRPALKGEIIIISNDI